MTLIEALLVAALGGIFTSIAIPLSSYFIVRLLNKFLVCVKIDERDEFNYKVYNIKIQNCSLVTLKNMTTQVTIDNNKNDIISNSRIKIFCEKAKVDNGLLSWSKNVNNNNFPQIDINQGESPDINLIRYHFDDPQNAIEIASEQGFFDGNNKSRTVLNANRNYMLNVLITGENLWPKRRTFTFNHTSKQLIKNN